MTELTRYDFTDQQAVTPGEVWNFRFPVYVDGTTTLETDFSSYSGWKFYMFRDLDAAGKTAALRAASDYFSGAIVSGSGITASVPNVDVEVSDTQNANVPTDRRAYELWATVNGKLKRLAFGTIPVVN